MKLGIVLLIVGVILTAVGVGLRQYGISLQDTSDLAKYANLIRGTSPGVMQESVGLGLLVCGGGLVISGIVVMILKRQPKG